MNDSYEVKIANTHDIFGVIGLFQKVYKGDYPDHTVYSYESLLEFIDSPKQFICIAKDFDLVIGAVFYKYDTTNRISKVYGASVLEEYRGRKITERLMKFGEEYFTNNGLPCDIIYATTRTVHKSAQKITEKTGFKKLGIFPNVHKTDDYETHGLVVKFNPKSLEKRMDDFELHPKVLPLYKLACDQLNIKEPSVAVVYSKQKSYEEDIPPLEIIKASNYVNHKLVHNDSSRCMDLAFYPFHKANRLITSANGDIEVFCHFGREDGHCAILGIVINKPYCLIRLLDKCRDIFRKEGVRYIEMITKAHRVKIVDTIIAAGFIPCGYFPAFQYQDEKRYDYVVFSHSLESFNFKQLQLEGTNLDFLKYYYNLWKEAHLSPSLLE